VDEMVIPSFLQNQSFEENLAEMISVLPEDIDVSEGSHPYNLLAPTAYEKARIAEFVLVECIKLIFPQFCGEYDDYVDYHAQTCGITRKAAEKATGTVTVTGTAGTEIEDGTVFSTVSINGSPAIAFQSTESAIIGTDGTVDIPIEAVEAGASGNVSAATIILMETPLQGVTQIANAEATDGGLDEESSESLISRIAEYEASQGESFVGNIGDYKRWALEVPGTGGAQIIDAQDGSGLVTIILTDAYGEPATTGDDLCKAVYNHIMSPDDPESRLAPCGAKLSVIGPSTITVTISATVNIDGDTTTIGTVSEKFLSELKSYLIEAADDGNIVYTKVGSILSQISGVKDYSSLKLNGGTSNVSVTSGSIPQTSADNITLTEA
jgi:uncharacterized phage protein gp47/JayE